MGLYEWVEEAVKAGTIKETYPLKLDIGIDGVSVDGTTRYMTVKLGGYNITHMIAKAADYKISGSKQYRDSLIIHGCGMDMCFALQNRVYQRACNAGYPDMFDNNYYNYLGVRKRGVYPYEEDKTISETKTEITSVESLRSEYRRLNPDGHFFDKKTLAFFGESVSSMKLRKDPVHITDERGQERDVYVLRSYQTKNPDGPQWATHYFDVDTLDLVFKGDDPEIETPSL